MSRSSRSGDCATCSVPNVHRDFLALLAVIVLLACSTSAASQVLIVLSDGAAGYDAVADELRAGLRPGRENLRVDSINVARLTVMDGSAFGAYELVVPVGLAAAQAVMSREQDLPVPPRTLCLLIPRQSFERLAPPASSERSRRVTALFIDQPLSRQFDLLRLALPERRRVGVILGPSSKELETGLRNEARSRELRLNVAQVGESSGVYAALQSVMPDSDLFLLLPDPVATNADTVYGLLLTSYRAQTPVVGYSEGLLNAGALVSLFSTARQQGRQGAEIAGHILAHGALPAPQHPKYFTVRVNASVARSLGLHVPAEAALYSALSERADAAGENPAREAQGDAAPRSQP